MISKTRKLITIHGVSCHSIATNKGVLRQAIVHPHADNRHFKKEIPMALKVFSVKDKATGQVVRLVKAETRGQVNKYLQNAVEVEAASALDIADLLTNGSGLKLESAESVDAGDADEVAAPAAAAPAPAAEATPVAAVAPTVEAAPVAETPAAE